MFKCSCKKATKTSLRRGDMVMVISGGSGTKRVVKGRVGKIVRFVGKEKNRAIVEGLNMVTRHTKAKKPGEKAARIQVEAPIAISRLMYYVEKIKKPVRLGHGLLADGKKVRGYKDPQNGEFVQLAD